MDERCSKLRVGKDMNKKTDRTISVIIPVYNVSQYVLQAVNSVLEQTFQAFEVIIVNDGSTDNSGELLEQHYSKISNVTIIHTENQGLGRLVMLAPEQLLATTFIISIPMMY